MISLRVFIATLALAVKLDGVRAADMWSSPFGFSYFSNGTHHDTINVDIKLQNVPAEANNYAFYYQTDKCDKSTTEQNSAAGCDVYNDGSYILHVTGQLDNVAAKYHPIPTNRTITVTQRLDRGSIRIYIELRNKNKVCVTKRIMDGVSDAYPEVNKFHEACINKLHDIVCDVIADFENKCEEPTPVKLNCTQHERLMCRDDTDADGFIIPEDTVHHWYQEYKDGSVIESIPPVKGSKTEFKMKIYTFDSNTYIYSVMRSAHWENDLRTEKYKTLPSNTTYEKNDNNMKTKKYTEIVNFNCPIINALTLVGWIEPTGNKITTYTMITNNNMTGVSLPFTKEQNSSWLCCVNYRNYTDGVKTVVERTITDITVLMYDEPVNQDNQGSTTERPSRSTNPAHQNKPTGTPYPWTLPQSTTPSGSAEQHGTGPDPQSHTDNTKYYIAIAAVAGIILLAALSYVVVKKYWRKASDPDGPLQLETYATANAVLYAELDIRPSTGQPPVPAPDATYAEIIGVLRPQNGHIKK